MSIVNNEAVLVTQANTLHSLIMPVNELLAKNDDLQFIPKAIERGLLRPAEDEALAHWYAKYLSLRGELWSIIRHCDEMAGVSLSGIRTGEQWRCFVIAYTAACLLVRIDRYFLFELATDKLIQKKLNQSFKEYRIPPRTFTQILDRFTNPKLAFKLYEAMWKVRLRRFKIRKLRSDAVVGQFVVDFPLYQSYLDPSKRNYIQRTAYFLKHAVTRKVASAKQKSMFAVLEKLGRATAEIAIDNSKQVTTAIQKQALELLLPGDVLVTRHKYALSNFFLPGTWPHVALFVGTQAQRQALDVKLSAKHEEMWDATISTFESKKDGVKLRTLDETLHVDYFAIIRPKLSQQGIKEGIERVLKHEGKRYNFDFDFFRSDRLVCTEVIYRAFDGLEGMQFTLSERAGRQTLSAEDLLDMAMDSDAYELIGLFGYPQSMPIIVTGERASQLLLESYR
ncbi:MAG: YiiX/YebB-like N1pC/P60 family cysteine hydrolase [Granulosicoccaceae bacterium]